MTTLSENARGALLMIFSMAAFTFGDACIKAIGTDLPLSQILVLRGIVASLFIGLLCWRMGGFRTRPAGRDWALVMLRGLAEAGSAYFFLGALRYMPLANVTALLQMLPLTVTLGAALVFREAVGWRRWLAIATGFGGMLLIVRPGTEGFDQHSIYALISVLCVTVRDLSTRRVSRQVHSMLVTLISALTVVLLGGVWALNETWVPMDARLSVLLGGATLFIIFGYSMSVMTMRVGEVAVVAPFRYTGLVWALLIGFLVFGDWPHPLTLIGAALIVGMGLFTLWREARARQRVQAKTVRM